MIHSIGRIWFLLIGINSHPSSSRVQSGTGRKMGQGHRVIRVFDRTPGTLVVPSRVIESFIRFRERPFQAVFLSRALRMLGVVGVVVGFVWKRVSSNLNEREREFVDWK